MNDVARALNEQLIKDFDLIGLLGLQVNLCSDAVKLSTKSLPS